MKEKHPGKDIPKWIPLFKVKMAEGLEKPIADVLYSGYVGQGEQVEKLEVLLATKLANHNLLTVNSGTSALHLLFHMFGNDGDEVLASPLTCSASNFPILANRLKIKWVDIDDSCNMDLVDLERKLSPTTKIILLVHWGGNPIDLRKIEEIRLKCYSLYGFMPIIIQDNAHSIGSSFYLKPLAYYHNSAYSFQAIKQFTTVDGGCITLENENDYERAKLLRWYGLDRENKANFRCEQNIEEWGYKFHMNDLNATIGIRNYSTIDETVKKHIDNSRYYDHFLKHVSGIKNIHKTENSVSSQWIHTIHVEKRSDFIQMMNEHKIEVSQVHRRNDLHTCVHDYKTLLPNMNKIDKTMICIPNGWWVSKEDRDYIIDVIKKGW